MNANSTSAPCGAVVFDLDGTLIDSAPSARYALNRLLAPMGREPLDLEQARIVLGGSGGGHVGRALAATGGIPSDRRELRALEQRYRALRDGEAAHLTKAYRGVNETLDALKQQGTKLGISTKRPVRSAESILELLNLRNYFSVVSGRDSVPMVKKPQAAHLLAVLAELESPVQGAVMVGDKASDVAMARSAGVPAILIAGGYSEDPPESLGADAVLRGFADLPAALAKILT